MLEKKTMDTIRETAVLGGKNLFSVSASVGEGDLTLSMNVLEPQMCEANAEAVQAFFRAFVDRVNSLAQGQGFPIL